MNRKNVGVKNTNKFGENASESLWTQSELENALSGIELEYSRLLDARAGIFWFDYMQTKTRLALVILEHFKELADAADMTRLTNTSYYYEACGQAGHILNARKHWHISRKDSKNYMNMLYYIYGVIMKLRRHIRR